jgi:hypothetical protein
MPSCLRIGFKRDLHMTHISIENSLTFSNQCDKSVVKLTSILTLWLQCSVTCGEGGVETRYVACLVQRPEDDSEQIVSENYCDMATQPSAERQCRLADCTRSRRGKPNSSHENVVKHEVNDGSSTEWRTGPWSPVDDLIF